MFKKILTAGFCLTITLESLAHPSNHQSIAALSQRIEQRPELYSYLQRAELYILDGQYDKAVADIRASEQLKAIPYADFLLGQISFKKKRFQAAIEYLSEFLKHQPNNTQALQLRAQAYEQQKKHRLRFADLRMALNLSPKLSPALVIATAEAAKAAHGVASALSVIDEGIAGVGFNPQLQQKAVLYEKERGYWQQALVRLDSLASELQDSPEWHVARAELLIELSLDSQALDALNLSEGLLSEYRKTPLRQKLLTQVLNMKKQVLESAKL